MVQIGLILLKLAQTCSFLVTIASFCAWSSVGVKKGWKLLSWFYLSVHFFLPFPSRSGDPSVGRDAGSKLWAWNDVLHKPPVPASQFLGEKHSARKREPSPAKPMPKIRLYHKSTFWKIERLIKSVFLLLLCVMVNFFCVESTVLFLLVFEKRRYILAVQFQLWVIVIRM